MQEHLRTLGQLFSLTDGLPPTPENMPDSGAARHHTQFKDMYAAGKSPGRNSVAETTNKFTRRLSVANKRPAMRLKMSTRGQLASPAFLRSLSLSHLTCARPLSLCTRTPCDAPPPLLLHWGVFLRRRLQP